MICNICWFLFAIPFIKYSRSNQIECNIDLAFLIDQSGSLSVRDFKSAISFVESLTDRFIISPLNTRLAFVSFDDLPRIDLLFKNEASTNATLFKARINNIKRKFGNTRTDLGLGVIRNHVFNPLNGSRLNAPKTVVIVTDGGCDRIGVNNLRLEKDKFNELSINIIAVGIGKLINSSELRLLASEPKDKHLFTLTSYNLLTSIIEYIVNGTCNYVECIESECSYSEWTEWTGTCGAVYREKYLIKEEIQIITKLGSCSGIPTTCSPKLQQTETLTNCSGNCLYKDCNVNQWSQWTESCGLIQRTRNIKPIDKLIFADSISCEQVTTTINQTDPCFNYNSVETTSILCACPSKLCNYYDWSDWSSNCGLMNRSRRLSVKDVILYDFDCSNIANSCEQILFQEKIIPCMYDCFIGDCIMNEWTEWSSNCGVNITRSRNIELLVTQNRQSICDEEHFNINKTTCDKTENFQIKSKECSCSFEYCVGQWSPWNSTCSLGYRYKEYNKLVHNYLDYNCENVPIKQLPLGYRNCNELEIEEEYFHFDECIHQCMSVSCEEIQWSSWSSTCGYSTRYQQFIPKTRYSNSSICLTDQEIELASSECINKIVTEITYLKSCDPQINLCTTKNDWSTWSSTCGLSFRTKRMSESFYLHEWIVLDPCPNCSIKPSKIGCFSDNDVDFKSFHKIDCSILTNDLCDCIDEAINNQINMFFIDSERNVYGSNDQLMFYSNLDVASNCLCFSLYDSKTEGSNFLNSTCFGGISSIFIYEV